MLIIKAELGVENLKEVVFDGKLFKFQKNKAEINKFILGESFVFSRKINSLIFAN